jgi:hypothetical protein
LYNIGGTKLFDVNCLDSSLNVDLSSYKKGIYILKIITEKSETVNKIIKK